MHLRFSTARAIGLASRKRRLGLMRGALGRSRSGADDQASSNVWVQAPTASPPDGLWPPGKHFVLAAFLVVASLRGTDHCSTGRHERQRCPAYRPSTDEPAKQAKPIQGLETVSSSNIDGLDSQSQDQRGVPRPR